MCVPVLYKDDDDELQITMSFQCVCVVSILNDTCREPVVETYSPPL